MEPTTQTQSQKNNSLSTPSAIVIAGFLIAASIFLSGRVPYVAQGTGSGVSNTAVKGATVTAPAVGNMKPISPADHFRGNANAQLVIVEYSDLECPFCKVFHATLQKLMDEYGASGKLAWVYRNYPIPTLHPKAPSEAYAAECANVVGGNDTYWKYIDEVFKTTNSNNSLDPVELPKIASDVGLDLVAWNACVKSGQTTTRVSAESADAVVAGALGTPYSVLINNKTGDRTAISGAQPYETVKGLIDAALKK